VITAMTVMISRAMRQWLLALGRHDHQRSLGVRETLPTGHEARKWRVGARLRRSVGKAEPSTAVASSGDAGIEKNVRKGSYSPPHIRVATYDRVFRSQNGDTERQFHKVVAAWRWTASSNR
jgi:hypothetical protein